MDDQFNGRTDDDLFADDFEPVEATYVEATDVEPSPPPTAKATESSTAPIIGAAPSPAPASVPATAPEEAQASAPIVAPAALVEPATIKPAKQSSLSQSRHNTQHQHQNQNQKPRQRKHSPKPKPAAASSDAAPDAPAATATNATPSSMAPPTAPTGPAATGTTSNTAGPNRHLSGQNPRTKLTAAQLEEKMAAMKLANAERTRKFEQAALDERSHELALKRGEEDARRRRAEDAERRRRNEEDRKKLEEERQRNRERKLKALGSWDQEKNLQEEPERRNFRGANGGIRGERRGGLGGSRFADRDAGADEEGGGVREFAPGEFRGRGRGRGRGGSIRGGGERGGHGRGGRGDGERNGHSGAAPKPAEAPPKSEDFPALPAQPKKIDTTGAGPAVQPSELPALSPLGKWDEEMSALDARTAQGS